MVSLLSTVVTSAVVASITGALMNAWLDSRKSNHTTRFDALTAAVTLEGYGITCADKIEDHDLAISSDGSAGSFLASVPELPQLTIAAGFLRPQKALVANRLMIFPQEVRQGCQAVAFWWDVTADVDVARNAAVAEAAKAGLNALVLAEDIREAFRLPKRKLSFGNFNVREVLENNLRGHSGDSVSAS